MASALAGALVLAGCGGAKSDACAPAEGKVIVCLNGQPIAWTAKTPAHAHEGFFYGPAEELARHLGTKIEISPDKKTVTVNGKKIEVEASDKKNIHLHDDVVYAPIKQVAEAAGLKVNVDAARAVISITR